MQVKKFDDYSKLSNEMSKHRVYCDCGHSILIYPFEKRDKKICNFCGNLVYKNDLAKFKCLLTKKMKEVSL